MTKDQACQMHRASLIVTICRFVGVPGLGCFDLDTYLTMAERSRKWQCPHSMRNMSIRELHIDTYVSRLLPFFQVAYRTQAPIWCPRMSACCVVDNSLRPSTAASSAEPSCLWLIQGADRQT
jgi:hypothetical protein